MQRHRPEPPSPRPIGDSQHRGACGIFEFNPSFASP
jgi:hypothetical protein